jgi:hypothetical protein
MKPDPDKFQWRFNDDARVWPALYLEDDPPDPYKGRNGMVSLNCLGWVAEFGPGVDSDLVGKFRAIVHNARFHLPTRHSGHRYPRWQWVDSPLFGTRLQAEVWLMSKVLEYELRDEPLPPLYGPE